MTKNSFVAEVTFKVTAAVKVGKKVIKAIVQFFNSKIADVCSVQSGDIFARALSSVLL